MYLVFPKKKKVQLKKIFFFLKFLFRSLVFWRSRDITELYVYIHAMSYYNFSKWNKLD